MWPLGPAFHGSCFRTKAIGNIIARVEPDLIALQAPEMGKETNQQKCVEILNKNATPQKKTTSADDLR